jgi:hypothetical protein
MRVNGESSRHFSQMIFEDSSTELSEQGRNELHPLLWECAQSCSYGHRHGTLPSASLGRIVASPTCQYSILSSRLCSSSLPGGPPALQLDGHCSSESASDFSIPKMWPSPAYRFTPFSGSLGHRLSIISIL